ncbi:helix-turn-helix domain-containing protein [Arhodomonas aquaeolei]|uniref:helix-turn-helix domain-containing protein n=1 Tax=Arhodomonas aquaeolei TaxID=2369 RepID=UPI00036DCCB3|nr:helix-turn-helix transcriptional regulator [Arhodomonas aquaeolei]
MGRGAYGKAVRRVRQFRGVAQDSMAPAISRSYISELERGRKQPTVVKVEDLCRVLHTPPLTAYILAFADSPADVDRVVDDAAALAKQILNTDSGY